MCCRYLLFRAHLKEAMRKLGVAGREEAEDRYNISPGRKIPAVRRKVPRAETGEAALVWGLKPAWMSEEKAGSGFFNARAEHLASKPSFREPFRERRCLVPASGFYEWEKRGRERQPWLFKLKTEEPFYFAGLWEPSANGLEEETCAVVTTEANGLMRTIHHRMPVILTGEAALQWLEPGKGEDVLEGLLVPFPEKEMTALAVSKRVNSVDNDDERCLQPADTDEAAGQAAFLF